MNDIGFAIANSNSPSNRTGQATQGIATPAASEIAQRMNALHGVISSLNGIIDDLHGQLRPVLQELPPSPPLKDPGVNPNPTLLIAQLDQQINRVVNLVDELRGIRSRLHV